MQLELKLNEYEIVNMDWEVLKAVPFENHDKIYIDILRKHGFHELKIPIPLKARYSKGRKWSKLEFKMCYEAWKRKTSITLIAATLNRNPQDIIYKLLDRCKKDKIQFSQKGRTENTDNWTPEVRNCSLELFENGLPAWRIAVLFRVEFEYVEKQMFVKRKGYGHEKKNPFTINTDHKQWVNKSVIDSLKSSKLTVLEAFAGEGRFTKTLQESNLIESITCIENNQETFERLKENVGDEKVKLIFEDNLAYFKNGKLKKYNIIDIDPFVTCYEQLDFVWNFLKNNSYLFITFGGEYRRSFIKTNRKSINKRYNFLDTDSDNSTYLEIIPYYFLGRVAKLASINGFEFEVIRAVRYANNCRYWLKTKKSKLATEWLEKNVNFDEKGICFKNIHIPRFREVRKEIDNAKKQGFSR